MPGYLFGPAIAEEQDTYPDVTFIAVDVTEGDIVKNGKAVDLGKNVYICSFEEEQAGYLCLLYTSPRPRDRTRSRMPSSA